MQDGIITMKDPHTNEVECKIKVHFRREYPEEVIKLCLDYIGKALEEWQDRVVELEMVK